MIKLGLSIFEDDKADDDDMPALDEDNVEEADTNKMEEVDWSFWHSMNNIKSFFYGLNYSKEHEC